MKKLLSIFTGFSIIFLLLGCADKSSVESTVPTPTIDKEFIEANAKIGLSKSEIKEAFGEKYTSGTADGGEIWMYDTTKAGYDYERKLGVVAHEEIKNGNVKYQLFINFNQDKAFMYSFFYKGKGGKVWEYVLNPDKTTLEIPVSQ